MHDSLTNNFGFEDGGRDQVPRECMLPLLKQAGNGFFPGTSRKECCPANTLILIQGDLCQTSDFLNFNKIINLCCFYTTKLVVTFYSNIKKLIGAVW